MPDTVVEKKDVHQLKEVVLLSVEVINSAIAVAKDGKIGLDDLPQVLRLIPMVAGLSGISEIPAEAKDIDADELADLTASIVAKLAVDDAKAKLVIEKSLKLIAVAGDLVLTLTK